MFNDCPVARSVASSVPGLFLVVELRPERNRLAEIPQSKRQFHVGATQHGLYLGRFAAVDGRGEQLTGLADAHSKIFGFHSHSPYRSSARRNSFGRWSTIRLVF